MGEVGIEVGDLTLLEAGPGSCPCAVFRMLSDLEEDPLVDVVDAPYTALVLETGFSRLGRGVDSPLVGWREFPDSSPLGKGGDRLFEYWSCGEGPYRGSLSLERDRRGGIVDGFAGREELGCIKRLGVRDTAKIRKVKRHMYKDSPFTKLREISFGRISFEINQSPL